MSELASSNGRTPNFDFGNSGSNPLARATPKALSEQLRALVPGCDDPSDYTADDLVMLACADRIEALEAERDRLLKLPVIADYIALRDRAEALEKALREIAKQDIVELTLDPDWPRRIARAALSPTPER